MATVTKRNNSYRIKVSNGYDSSGKQRVVSKTWTPAQGMTEKQIAKELEKANNTLKMTIDGVLSEEQAAMDAIAKELEIMKMSK